MLRINKFQNVFLFITLLVLPFQLGKHFWPTFAYVAGQRVDYLSPTLYLSDVVISLLFFLTFWPNKFSTGKVSLGLLGVLLLLSVGIFFSPAPLVGWYFLLKLLEYIFFGWLVSKQKEITRKLFWAFFIGILVEGILGILQFFHQGSLDSLWYFLGERSFTASTPGIANASIHGQLVLRPYATFPHPNVFAGYLVITLLFFMTRLFTHKDKTQKIISAIGMVFGFTILLLTLSRVAIVTFVLVGIVFLFLKLPKQKSRFLFVSCGLLLVVFLSNSFLLGRFFDSSSYTESLSLRDALMQSAFTMFVSHPVFGVGLGNFLVALPHHISGKILFGFLQPVHNIFLLVLAETGIFGLGVFLLILVSAFRNALKNWKTKADALSQFAFLGLVAICCIGMTDHYFLTLQQGQLLFALVLGLCFRRMQVA